MKHELFTALLLSWQGLLYLAGRIPLAERWAMVKKVVKKVGREGGSWGGQGRNRVGTYGAWCEEPGTNVRCIFFLLPHLSQWHRAGVLGGRVGTLLTRLSTSEISGRGRCCSACMGTCMGVSPGSRLVPKPVCPCA